MAVLVLGDRRLDADEALRPTGWSRSALRRPVAPRSPSFVTTDTGTFTVQHLLGMPTEATGPAQKVAERRRKELRRVTLDAVLAAIGLRPRLYPRPVEGRLAAALVNVRNDHRNRADT